MESEVREGGRGWEGKKEGGREMREERRVEGRREVKISRDKGAL